MIKGWSTFGADGGPSGPIGAYGPIEGFALMEVLRT